MLVVAAILRLSLSEAAAAPAAAATTTTAAATTARTADPPDGFPVLLLLRARVLSRVGAVRRPRVLHRPHQHDGAVALRLPGPDGVGRIGEMDCLADLGEHVKRATIKY